MPNKDNIGDETSHPTQPSPNPLSLADDEAQTVTLSNVDVHSKAQTPSNSFDDEVGETRVITDLAETDQEDDTEATRRLADLTEEEDETRFITNLANIQDNDDEDSTRFISNVGVAEPEADKGATIALSQLPSIDHDQTIVSLPPAVPMDEETTVRTADLEPPLETDITQPSPILESQKKSQSQTTKNEISKDTLISVKADAIKLGDILQNRYRLDKLIGKGGFGAAYLAEDIRLKRPCVVKQMLIPRRRSVKQIEQLKQTFEAEANTLAALNQPGHPSIPEIYDYFPDETGLYLVMKYIEGQDLKKIVKESDINIPWRESVRYIIDVCDALIYMHAHGNASVIHRDVKPANIILGGDGRVWLVDFGLASAGAEATEASGSPGYTPFEQWIGEAVPTSDIYATGVTLHHLITQYNPLDAFAGKLTISKIENQHGKLPSLNEFETLDETIPKEFDAILKATVATDPEKRPTATQLKQQLELLISNDQTMALFTFKNGVSAFTIDQLVDLCEQHRQEAQRYLYQRDFERWFSLINRNDLAEAARQAIKQYPERPKAGLEKFLKLARPGLLWRRLRRTGVNVMKVAAIFILSSLVVATLMIIASAYGSRYVVRGMIANYPWSFYTLTMDEPNIFDEAYLSKSFTEVVGNVLENPTVDTSPPNQLYLQGKLHDFQITVPLELQLVDDKPQFEFPSSNQWLEFFITDNVAIGVNEGIDDAFRNGPVDITNLWVADHAITFTITESKRVPWLTPTPGPSATPTPLPPPTVTPTPEGPALVVVYNDLSEEIILEIEGESWNILPYNNVVVEKLPGIYTYRVIYRRNGQLAAEGTQTWDVKAYRWRIDIADIETE